MSLTIPASRGRWLLAALATACGEAPVEEPSQVQFNDVAAESGLRFEHFNGFSGEYFFVETAGPGGAFIDADADGWLDVYLVDGARLVGSRSGQPPVNRMFRNRGGAFTDVTDSSGAGDPGYGMGCTAGDFDNDGDPDLYVTNYGANRLLQNDRGRFADVTAAAGVGDERWGTSAGFFDYDGDGDLDLMAVNYVDFSLDRNIVCHDRTGIDPRLSPQLENTLYRKGRHRTYCDPTEYEPLPDLLYRNDWAQSGRFTDVTESAGVFRKGRGLGLAFSDYDLDGDTDAYVANDKDMNFLYENRQDRFEEVGLRAGVRYNAEGLPEAGMGVDFGDVENDGDPDLYVTNFAYETNTLYGNDGQGEFRDDTIRAGLAESSLTPLGFGTRFMDFDHDGFVDLFVANGHVLNNIDLILPGLSYPQPNQMLRNLRGRGFEDVSDRLGAGFRISEVSRGAAVADYDNDGDLDILVNNVQTKPTLLRNDGGNRGNWLLVELEGRRQLDALGARVVAVAAGLRQVRERQSGGSYLASHDHRLHFGLAGAAAADLEITWPDGARQELRGLRANRLVKVRQGEEATLVAFD